jgi:hypothetical protein
MPRRGSPIKADEHLVAPRARSRRKPAGAAMRTATETGSVAEAVRGVTELLREQAAERAEVDKLKQRLDRLEQRSAG